MKCQRAVNKVQYAWGIGRHTIQRIIKKVALGVGSLKRKQRKDKGLTVFNSQRTYRF